MRLFVTWTSFWSVDQLELRCIFCLLPTFPFFVIMRSSYHFFASIIFFITERSRIPLVPPSLILCCLNLTNTNFSPRFAYFQSASPANNYYRPIWQGAEQFIIWIQFAWWYFFFSFHGFSSYHRISLKIYVFCDSRLRQSLMAIVWPMNRRSMTTNSNNQFITDVEWFGKSISNGNRTNTSIIFSLYRFYSINYISIDARVHFNFIFMLEKVFFFSLYSLLFNICFWWIYHLFGILNFENDPNWASIFHKWWKKHVWKYRYKYLLKITFLRRYVLYICVLNG